MAALLKCNTDIFLDNTMRAACYSVFVRLTILCLSGQRLNLMGDYIRAHKQWVVISHQHSSVEDVNRFKYIYLF